MATATTAYDEHRFGAAYTIRMVLAMVVLAFIGGLWGSQNDPRIEAHPTLLWISLALVAATAGLWIIMGKSSLIINDSGVRREEYVFHGLGETCSVAEAGLTISKGNDVTTSDLPMIGDGFAAEHDAFIDAIRSGAEHVLRPDALA